MIAADLRRFGALVIAPIVAVLAACTPAASEPAPTPTPSPSPSQTPFAEKNAAAIEAYKRYEEMLEETLMSGGYQTAEEAPPSVRATTMGEERQLVDQDNIDLAKDKAKGTGQVTIRNIAITSSVPMPGAPGGHQIKIVACRDNSGARIIEGGRTSEPPQRLQEVRVTLYFDEETPAGWKVSEQRGKGVSEC
ncbi:hypothetical protein [Naumannella huperziae]